MIRWTIEGPGDIETIVEAASHEEMIENLKRAGLKPLLDEDEYHIDAMYGTSDGCQVVASEGYIARTIHDVKRIADNFFN